MGLTVGQALDLDPYSEETSSPGKFQISLEIIPSNALDSLPHDLSNLELKLTGRVIWGEQLLERIPTELSLVPSTSGLRHVLNKLIGLLEQWGPWVDERRPPSQEIALTISYHRAKVLLDLASAILLVRGAWVAGYGARLNRLKELETAGPLLPSIGILGPKVEEALNFKLNPVPPPTSDAAFLWEKAKDELLGYVEAISATVLGYEESDPMDGYTRFLPRARYGLLGPYADQALAKLGLPTASWAAKPIVAVYSGVESLRLGQVQLIHPLIRAYACAWAWLADSEAGKNLDFIDRLTMSYPGKRRKTKQSMRNRTVELFKACATRKRRKRVL